MISRLPGRTPGHVLSQTGFVKRKRDRKPPEPDDRPALWVRLVKEEVKVRMDAELKGEAYLDVELQMLATMRSRYPDVPTDLASEFARRLNAGALRPSAWDEAVNWLEGTDWFKRH